MAKRCFSAPARRRSGRGHGGPGAHDRRKVGAGALRMLDTGLLDGGWVRLGFLVGGERAVDAGHARVAALALTGRDEQVRADLLDGLTVGTPAQHGMQHVLGDDGRAATVFAFAGPSVVSRPNIAKQLI